MGHRVVVRVDTNTNELPQSGPSLRGSFSSYRRLHRRQQLAGPAAVARARCDETTCLRR